MKRTADPSVSLLARLRHLAGRYPNVPRSAMLLLYAQQGFLGRLTASPYRDQFVLKGALSLFARYGDLARPTEDVDLAARGLPNTPGAVEAAMREVCAVAFSDGLTFDPDAVRVRVINDAPEYPGVNVSLTARLGASRATFPVDVSFGNVITPAPAQLTFPPLLVDEAVQVAVYPLETVVTEKFAALVELGVLTTRMKDLYDLHVILNREPFDAALLRAALEGSFAARGTPTRAVPLTLSPDFARDDALTARWTQYRRRTGLAAPEFEVVMAELRAFFAPILLHGRVGGLWRPDVGDWA